MKFLKNNMYTLLALAIVFTMALTGDASAQSTQDSVMTMAQTKAANVFKSVKTIVFVIGGFGLVALAFQAIFGKVKWPMFAGLAFGLAVLAAAGYIVDYATGAKNSAQGSVAGTNGLFADTFSGQ